MGKILTTANGAPIPDDNTSISAGKHGSLTFDNFRLFEKLAHFNRERIPERVVHARGTGSYGTFTLERDLSDLTIADFLIGEGKQTEVFVRFSTVGGGQDSSDYARDPRGTAIKFYTKQGNFDLVGNNTPIFFLRDPSKFPDFIHSQKKNPQTNLPDPAAMYEFWSKNPQSLHQMTILMSDRGIPRSYRHMHMFSSHTLSLYDSEGNRFWVKWHFKTQQGIDNFTNEEAAKQPSFGAQKDLFDAIKDGNYPKWDVNLQVMTEEDAKKYYVNPFDLTKVWSHKDFPLQKIGVLELNRNVNNYFAEVEQATFAPNNLVPGVGISPDKMLQARLLAYQDAHRYRVGVNASHLPVNASKCPMHNYQRDGAMAGTALNVSQNEIPNFYPNAHSDSPVEIPEYKEPPLEILGDIDYYDAQDEDNYSQVGDLYRLIDESQKNQLANNIAEGLIHATAEVQELMLEQFNKADRDYKVRVEKALSDLA
ncbi:catalase [Pseudofrancisella aestuarii]|uniref:catalase n=1 Tax=Pseudofrancisella aestuarii TaxID=2670347 RepID=A0ABV9T8R3_9GAMM|nr:catalase [Pseudofrancisella aestuarii]